MPTAAAATTGASPTFCERILIDALDLIAAAGVIGIVIVWQKRHRESWLRGDRVLDNE